LACHQGDVDRVLIIDEEEMMDEVYTYRIRVRLISYTVLHTFRCFFFDFHC
jgi:hypothetical protein